MNVSLHRVIFIAGVGLFCWIILYAFGVVGNGIPEKSHIISTRGQIILNSASKLSGQEEELLYVSGEKEFEALTAETDPLNPFNSSKATALVIGGAANESSDSGGGDYNYDDSSLYAEESEEVGGENTFSTGDTEDGPAPTYTDEELDSALNELLEEGK